MSAKLYKYYIYRQTGDITEYEPRKKMVYNELHDAVNGYIELIPKVFYNDGMNKRGTAYGNEESRFNSENIRNPHFKVITDIFGHDCDVVGDILFEQVAK